MLDDLPVLIVDDELSVLRALEKTVAAAGWPVTSASSPEQALELIAAQEFAVVVSDYWMPKVDGVQLLKAVRERWPHTERILLTAYADTEALERGINEAGISRFLRKPWKHTVLVSILEQAMQQSRLRREHGVLLERLKNRNEELSYLNQLLRTQVAETDRTLVHFRRRWDVALNAISDAVIIVDAALRIEGANEAASRLGGATFVELEGRPCHETLFQSSTPCEGCPIGSGSGRIHSTVDQKERTFDARAYALPGNPASHLCIYRDITRELAFQQEAAHMEKMAAIGRLAGGVAHELNNPLHGILSFVQIAQKPAVTPEKLGRAHEVIRECALRCRDIVQSLRDFARRPQSHERTELNLTGVCDKAVTLLSAIGKRRILRRGAWADVSVWGNANQLQQVIINLLQNAIDVTREDQAIEVEIVVDAGDAVVAVDDPGPGIPSAERATIFEPFYTTKPEGMGTGLGLAISHGIVQEHGGQLRVSESDLGGARFEMRLPRLKEAPDDA